MTDEIAYLSATSLRQYYAAGQLSPVEVVEALAKRISQFDAQLNALVTPPVLDQAKQVAAQAQHRYRTGTARALEGIPVVVKDLIDTAGFRTTYGSKMFADHQPGHDADIVARIREAGGVVFGKTATHEFGWGITTANEHFGATRNPWCGSHVPGGSSGGSAAALAAGFAPLALGTDTAGSVRIPAAFCGVVGLRPTHGAADMTGVQALAPSLDSAGPMARTVADVRLLHSVIAQEAGGRRISARRGVELTVGICRDLDQIALAPDTATVRDQAAALLAQQGAKVVELEAPRLPRLYEVLSTTVLSEGLWTHRRAELWPRRADDYGSDVRSRLRRAEQVSFDDYLSTQRDRARLRSAMAGLLGKVDVLLTPVSAVSPEPVSSELPAPAEPDFREQVMTSTAPQSLAGLPACSVRAGFDSKGLPVGLQLTAAAYAEQDLLDAAHMLYDATEHVQSRWPELAPTGSANVRT
ncbi:amidase [Saccharopolyspora shandongensis]|uniref:amidase n=1 Tax=Saccharopolyspora shandongensis TaxID=418495 RepID=UPI0034110A31